MTEYDLHQIDQIIAERRYDKGQVIIEENTPAERFFIIFRGKIEITKKFEDGEQFVLGVHSDGEFFGEIAALTGQPRSASVRALGPCELLRLSGEDLHALLEASPEVREILLGHVARREAETARRLTAGGMLI